MHTFIESQYRIWTRHVNLSGSRTNTDILNSSNRYDETLPTIISNLQCIMYKWKQTSKHNTNKHKQKKIN